eukprot:TRINITY_DN785_c0_g2_i1.p1 TRINITY_DN785_c0_g2~~TRINITY_DN785_c0_g2_i1.p1  ORF type:complete len:260 (+),score=47.63 TRINITY_DN785_c0_g2_i1:284-1063(+)
MGDSKYRCTGPEETTKPKLKIPPSIPLFVDKKRLDGRTNAQFRKIFFKTGIISQASGSAYIEMNNTKVICGVYGPRQTLKTQSFEKAVFTCEFKYTTFALNNMRRGYVPEQDEKDFSIVLVQALETSIKLDKFPKSLIDVYVLVIQDDGCALASAITCCSLALANAGIELNDIVAACSVSYVDDQILLDPTKNEEGNQKGGVTVARMVSLNEVTHVIQEGLLPPPIAVASIQTCIDGCEEVFNVMRKTLIETITTKESR